MTRSALICTELSGLGFLHLAELEREVAKGTFDTGLRAVAQAIGVKRA